MNLSVRGSALSSRPTSAPSRRSLQGLDKDIKLALYGHNVTQTEKPLRRASPASNQSATQQQRPSSARRSTWQPPEEAHTPKIMSPVTRGQLQGTQRPLSAGRRRPSSAGSRRPTSAAAQRPTSFQDVLRQTGIVSVDVSKPRPTGEYYTEDYRSKALALEVGLMEKLENLKYMEDQDMDEEISQEAIQEARRKVFLTLFDEVIAHDKIFGKLLRRVKDEICQEQFGSSESHIIQEAFDRVQLENVKYADKLHRLSDDHATLAMEHEKLIRENKVLREKVESRDKELDAIADKAVEREALNLKEEALQARVDELEADLLLMMQGRTPRYTEEINANVFLPGEAGDPNDHGGLSDVELQVMELKAQLDLARHREQQAMSQLSELLFRVETEGDVTAAADMVDKDKIIAHLQQMQREKGPPLKEDEEGEEEAETVGSRQSKPLPRGVPPLNSHKSRMMVDQEREEREDAAVKKNAL